MSALTLTFLTGRGRAVYMETQLDKRHKLEELARVLDLKASTDALTGIFNRFKFNQQLAIQITRVRRYGISLSLVIYDVDRFKSINDTYGHSAGDQVLRQLTEISARQMRNTDVHARWGGEEFVILAPDCTDMMACQMAELLRGRIERMSFDQVGSVTCSFGVAQFEFGDTAETLMARADSALYRAKQNGRNRVEIAETRQAMASALKTAV
jgi:diguanylate cyclase (GGDEF)-like protein